MNGNRPSPALLCTIALVARDGDTEGANALLIEHHLDRQPVAVVFAMLDLTRSLVDYLGGSLVATMNPAYTEQLTDDERTLLRVSDHVWSGERDAGMQMFSDYVQQMPPERIGPFLGAALGFASSTLVEAYTNQLGAVMIPDEPA